MGQEANTPGRAEDAATVAEVGARRYIRTKLRIDPTTRVEKTKSSSLRPKLGRDAMSPRTQALTPTSSSMRTLKGNCGSAETLARQPSRKIPSGLEEWERSSSLWSPGVPSEPDPPLLPPPPPPGGPPE